jgi:hypothetical protein
MNNDKKIYKFKLNSQKDESIHDPNQRQFSFYQICQFSINKLYAIRKLIYNEEAALVKYSEGKLKKEKLDRFLKGCPQYKYSLYPVYELNGLEFPDDGEILMARSQILNEY